MNTHRAFPRRLPLLAAAALAAAMASGVALADDITIDSKPFVSSASRSDVRSDFSQQPDWARRSNDYAYENPRPVARTSTTRAQYSADYKANRQTVSAMTAEDSGAGAFAPSTRRAVRKAAQTSPAN